MQGLVPSYSGCKGKKVNSEKTGARGKQQAWVSEKV